MRELHTAPAMISQHEESEDDPDYVDISDADINSHHEQENRWTIYALCNNLPTVINNMSW